MSGEFARNPCRTTPRNNAAPGSTARSSGGTRDAHQAADQDGPTRNPHDENIQTNEDDPHQPRDEGPLNAPDGVRAQGEPRRQYDPAALVEAPDVEHPAEQTIPQYLPGGLQKTDLKKRKSEFTLGAKPSFATARNTNTYAMPTNDSAPDTHHLSRSPSAPG